ncbi:hypothetical protein SJAG_04083 [Schizosaccharomyces japonicus yFS275]|uniref:Uncharacterized protein n=1 Tax=Schizosaccharomyces japonicus (strain yFS275 / FY16936) TaxID=402676 RepID=B6K5V7_SCHJY|nr:hypothetical protein SJAG_04083 [Schizosaccharomyces japonicus yFS275]EEB08911.1 hypothetical protein SJAG_04083 [Schizosaccharomyces japonicus yFS275]
MHEQNPKADVAELRSLVRYLREANATNLSWQLYRAHLQRREALAAANGKLNASTAGRTRATSQNRVIRASPGVVEEGEAASDGLSSSDHREILTQAPTSWQTPAEPEPVVPREKRGSSASCPKQQWTRWPVDRARYDLDERLPLHLANPAAALRRQLALLVLHVATRSLQSRGREPSAEEFPNAAAAMLPVRHMQQALERLLDAVDLVHQAHGSQRTAARMGSIGWTAVLPLLELKAKAAAGNATSNEALEAVAVRALARTRARCELLFRADEMPESGEEEEAEESV